MSMCNVYAVITINIVLNDKITLKWVAKLKKIIMFYTIFSDVNALHFNIYAKEKYVIQFKCILNKIIHCASIKKSGTYKKAHSE